jgi:hypothetical protein
VFIAHLFALFHLQRTASALPSVFRMQETRRLVYVIKSTGSTPHFYVGLTSDALARLAHHNAGRCSHTARYRPWQLHVTIALPDEQRLSTSSGT